MLERPFRSTGMHALRGLQIMRYAFQAARTTAPALLFLLRLAAAPLSTLTRHTEAVRSLLTPPQHAAVAPRRAAVHFVRGQRPCLEAQHPGQPRLHQEQTLLSSLRDKQRSSGIIFYGWRG